MMTSRGTAATLGAILAGLKVNGTKKCVIKSSDTWRRYSGLLYC